MVYHSLHVIGTRIAVAAGYSINVFETKVNWCFNDFVRIYFSMCSIRRFLKITDR